MTDDRKINPSSPFYLDIGDQPDNLITHVILKGNENYPVWSRAINLSLRSRRKFVFVDVAVQKPIEKKNLLDWETVNSMLVSWFLRTMEPKIAGTIPQFDEAKPLCNYLVKRFSVANGSRLQQIRAVITDYKKSKGMSIDDYYNRLMGLFDDLVRFKPLHACECGLCTCDVVGKFAGDIEEEKLHQFLIGVDDDLYALIQTNLLSQSSSPYLDRAYLTFIQEERSCGIAREKADKEQANVFALQTDRWNKGKIERRDNSKLQCSHCK